MGEEVSEGAQPDIALTFAIGFEEGVPGEGVGEEVAELEEVVEVGAALGGAHGRAQEVDTHCFVKKGVLLGATDVLTTGGVVGHH